MFDFAWSEIMLCGVVALIAIGPKDMPAAMKAVAGVVKKARRMASEFQGHVDEMMREADLHEVREQINEIRNFDIRGEMERTVDPDGSLRSTFTSNPLEAAPAPAVASTAATSEAVAGEAAPEIPVNYTLERPADPLADAEAEAPAFIPPSAAPATEPAEEPPAFVPPGMHRA